MKERIRNTVSFLGVGRGTLHHCRVCRIPDAVRSCCRACRSWSPQACRLDLARNCPRLEGNTGLLECASRSAYGRGLRANSRSNACGYRAADAQGSTLVGRFGTAIASLSATASQTRGRPLPLAKLNSNYPVVRLPVSQLRPTEKINIDRAHTLAKMIAENGRWTRPILVEQHHSMIMDGHHRHFCAGALGLSSVPCVLLSYDDPSLHVCAFR